MKILADASLPELSQAFPKPFELSVYKDTQELSSKLKGQQILFCRSTLKINEQLLAGLSHSLNYVATASSGTDHIDSQYLESNTIKIIDAKGSNAIAVADYVIATLAFLQKYRGFSGTEAGIIGVGEVGARVIERLQAAGMEVICNDPIRAFVDLNFTNNDLESLAQCDLICLHANLHEDPPFPSKDLLNERLLEKLKPGTVIINAARGGIVNEKALLKLKDRFTYCTDVYNNEPKISKEIVDSALLCTPHIAGHSIEAKLAAVRIVSEKLHAFFNLPIPQWQLLPKAEPMSLPLSPNWQDLVLSLYNPLNDTLQLKASNNLELDFQRLRKAHQNRHDFCNYSIEIDSSQIGRLLGV